MTADSLRVEALSRACQEILRGQGMANQGAVLADLLSLWLAGQVAVDEIGMAHRPNTEAVREESLRLFIATVRKLVPESEREIMARVEAQGTA